MKNFLINIFILLIAFSLCCCSNGFNRSKAEDILQKQEITEEEYDILLQQYEFGIDDAIKFSQKDQSELSEDNREEIITMFAIGKRLALDEDKLTPTQVNKFTEINHKGTEELSK
ncbi:MAG: hypothetical protein HDR88_08715 [Bacteroides sp.]|nr:hypothetical protein [Bacteroides sp.]